KDMHKILEQIQKSEEAISSLTKEATKIASFIKSSMLKMGVLKLMQGKYELKEMIVGKNSDISLYLNTKGSNNKIISVSLSTGKISGVRATEFFCGNMDKAYKVANIEDLHTFIYDMQSMLSELAGYELSATAIGKLNEVTESVKELKQAA
ncbi:MAG: phosphatidate phosphatase PAH1, partial [Pseudoalteromonas tetraodonis]